MSRVQLDRSDPKRNPIATIAGRVEAFPDAKFKQNGLYFRSDGALCDGQKVPKKAAPSPAAPVEEEVEVTVEEVREWVDSMKGPKGKKELVAYAEDLELEDPGKLGMGDLRDAIVEAFEAQQVE